MTEEGLKNALAALKADTRKQVVFELNAALIDTLVEYDKSTDSEIRSNLSKEAASLTCLKEAVLDVSREFTEICQKSTSQ